MIRRGVGLVAALACAALLLSGCDGSPGPSPSTTAPLFASEAEAFAAAEATYRAYIDAGNDRRAGLSTDPSVFLTGEALQSELEGQRLLDQKGLHVEGATTVAAFQGIRFTQSTVEALACLDATATRVLDESGADVTSPDRDSHATFRVTFVTGDANFLIASSRTSSESVCPES